jgi:hypothetical protein
MRVLLLNRRAHSEDGAVAAIVAILAVALLLMSAFAVDVGNAYANGRQLSVAADSAALASAAKVGEAIPIGQTCNAATLSTIDATTIAKQTADTINGENLKGNTTEAVKSVAVSCTPTYVEVTVINERAVPTTFGKLAGVDNITPTKSATARYVRVPTSGGLRPWAVCDQSAIAAQQAPNTTFATGLDNKIGACSAGPTSGNWGAVDFNGGNNAAGDLAAWTLNGYPNPVTIPNPLLPADPGVSNSSALRAAFTALVGQMVLFPTVTRCNGACNGNRATFDAVGIMTAKVCGIRYASSVYNAGSDCWSPTVQSALPTLPNGNPIDHIQFRWVNYTTTSFPGVNVPDCDFTNRQCVGAVELYR